MIHDPSKVLFVGLDCSAVCYYRCCLPASFLGADWIGLAGLPPKMLMRTGQINGKTQFPAFADYDLVVLQQPRGKGWGRIITELQSRGTKVLYEVDDYLHGIRNVKDHDFKRHFNHEQLEALELNMRLCDGLVCSTDYIARRYRRFNRNVWVCRNGIDPGRFNLSKAPRPTVNIVWAGATGHAAAIEPWLSAVANVMGRHGNVCFITIGQGYAGVLAPRFPNRCLATPFTLIDTYPAALSMGDIALAPAGNGAFFRGKSDLRWLEASSLGIPLVADPVVYHEIEDRVSGFHATVEGVEDVLEELVVDSDLRTAVGEKARAEVRQKRSFPGPEGQWGQVVDEVLGDRSGL